MDDKETVALEGAAGDFLSNRIRILKTGLYNVGRFIPIHTPEEIADFEQLARPGTRLMLQRVTDDPWDPFKIRMLAPDGRMLGYVTHEKAETAARLMDAGIEVIAVVSDSLPIHNDDYYHDDQVRASNKGWSKAERIRNGYRVFSLPYSLFMIDGSTK